MSDEKDFELTEPVRGPNGYLSAIDAFLNLSDIEITLTYGFAPEPIVFPVRLMMNDDEIEARTKFYLQNDEAKDAGRHAYHVDLLCSILTGRPRGLPGFDGLIESAGSPAVGTDLLKGYLLRGGGVAEKIATDAIERYNRMTTPAEFFR